MHLITNMLILIIAARILGRLFTRFNQPSIVGEMLAGVILGPSVLKIVDYTEALGAITDLAVFFIVIHAGLDMKLQDVKDSLKGRGIIVSLLAFFVPLGAGILIGYAYDLDPMKTLFLSLCISITALPVAIRILQSFGDLHTKISNLAISSAIVNDILGLLILGVLLNIPEHYEPADVVKTSFLTLGKLAILVIMVVGTEKLIEHFISTSKFLKRFNDAQRQFFTTDGFFSIGIFFVLIFGSISEVLGFHFVLGAFFAAVLISQDHFVISKYQVFEQQIDSISSGFLAPIFFASLGLEFNILEVESIDFIAVVLIASIVTKVFSGFIGGKILGFNNPDSLRLGAILNGRGVMELVIASIGYKMGFIGKGLFSLLMLMGVVTTMVTPFIYQYAKGKAPLEGDEANAAT